MKALLAFFLLTLSGMTAAGDSREEVEIAFDRYKGKLYAEYRRALVAHPGLAGKVVMEVDIGKTGTVSACRVKSTTMGNSDLPGKLCNQILLFKFPPRSAPITITKPVDFFPAG